MRITVIGESNIDVSVMPQGDTRQGGCTPAHISFHYGGVARNIAHNLKQLGHEVRLMTVFGSDAFAERLISDCKSIGLDLSLSTVFEQEKSPVFLSFNDASGNMQSALSDIKLNDRMDLDWVKGQMDGINGSDIVMADTLLSVDAIAWLIDHCTSPLYIDAVSPKRALRIAEALQKSEKKGFFALKCNLAEVQALTGFTEPFEASKSLNDSGIKAIYLTLGEKGAIFSSASENQHFPALPAQTVNATGSGDAFFAGVIHGNAIGLSGKETVAFGLEMAKTALEVEGPVAQRH